MPTKILAIDDSKTMRLAIKITFAAEDAEVTSVSKGSEALARVKQMGADVVLVDASLAQGEPSGYDVCRTLKGDAETARIPVLVMASSQTGVDQAKLRAVGADGYVLKPFETQELIDKVAEVLSKAASRPAAAAHAAAPAPAPAAPTAHAAAPVAAPPRPATITPTAPAPRPAATAPAAPSPAVVASTKPAEPVRVPPAPAPPSPAVRLAPAAAPPAPAPAPPRPAATPPAAAVHQPAAAARADAPIPIAIPIPFVSADAPTPGILERLRAGGGPAAGLDPKVAAALVALSREVIEQVVWEVVPDLAEEILQKNARARTG